MVAVRTKRMIMITRAPFFTASMVPVLLGTAIAWRYGSVHAGYLLLTLIGIIAIHAGLNMSNDYFDHLSGNDEINEQWTPFSGGSRTIQNGILSAWQVLRISGCLYLSGIAIGLYLALVRGWPILWLGVAGVFLAYFNSAPPFRLSYRGHGLSEMAVGIGFGPLIMLGSFYVQAQRFSYEALWASLPVAFLIAAVLYINEFPDYDADRATGKNTLVVVLARQRAVWGYVVLLGLGYGAIIIGVLSRVLPWAVLLALFTLPLSYRAIRGVLRFHSDTTRLMPTNAATIQIHLATGLLLCLGYAVEKMLG